MFSLIVTLVAIALVAALALATLYYGGSALTSSAATAEVARLNNEAAQISGAADLFHVREQRYANDVAELVNTNYLSGAPQTNWQTYQDSVVATGLDESQCLALNQTNGLSSIPACEDVAPGAVAVCCSEESP